MQAAYTLGMEPDGRELLVVVVKGTFLIPAENKTAILAKKQLPLVTADIFTGEPGLSAPLYESEFAPYKAKCDLLLNGSAHAPGGKPTTKVRVGLKLGSMAKTFSVVGNRKWVNNNGHITPSEAAQFSTMQISYDRAFGGLDKFHEDEAEHTSFPPNPIGKGYHKQLDAIPEEGTPMPNTEEDDRPITLPNENYRPMSFGPIGRGFHPRSDYAGTYDRNWLDNIAPFLPEDFDPAYYQCAPTDQQIDYPTGGEEVVMISLTPQGRTAFKLPKIKVPVYFFRTRQEDYQTEAVIDTVLLEPDRQRFSLVWRTHIPLKKKHFRSVASAGGQEIQGMVARQNPGQNLLPLPGSPAASQSGRGRRSMSQQPLAIVDCEMVTGVGLSAASSCAAIRCAIDNFQETRFMDRGGEWIMGSTVPLGESWRGETKLIKMLATSITELMARNPGVNANHTPLFLCLPEQERPGRIIAGNNAFFLALQEETGLEFHEQSRIISQGRVSVSIALARAREVIYGNPPSQVLIAGADSLLVGQGLTVFEENERLLTSQNSNGFIPGEAASAVLVSLPVPGGKPQLICRGVGFGLEAATIDSDAPLRADGMVKAIKDVTADAECGLDEVDFQLVSVSGEHYWFKEASLSLTRTLRVRKEEFDIWCPADCIGEVGAAIGPVMLSVALTAVKKDYAPGSSMICYFSNDDGKRAVSILSYQQVEATPNG
jgi:3-oxoacyl-[acyl-carrier-protein] synthase-1